MPDRLVVDLEGNGRARVLSWPDGGLVPEEVSDAPLTWPLDADALEDLRWYLEDYLLAPYGVWEERGPTIADSLAEWGKQAFESVFGAGPARFAYERARDRGLELIFRSANPGLLALPWELMRDGTGPVALGKGGISRSVMVADGAQTLEVPGGMLRVLMVISRPAGTSDVGYQMVARPLLERLDAVRGEVDLTVLRPPTFDRLREVVCQAADAGEPFHVVHFDGHGSLLARPVGANGALPGVRPPMMADLGEGVLSFEKPGGGSDPVGAAKVAQVLAEGQVPVVALNACQSGAVGKALEASVATALLRAGCAAVVAMAYSVYAVAAAEFMAAFYESLFSGETVGQAVTTGRKRLFEHDRRPSPKGDMPLADWLVPVHYLRRDVSFPQARRARSAQSQSLDEALNKTRSWSSEPATALDPLSPVNGVFVGRDDLLYQLETAARHQRVMLLTGSGGTGKTELAKGFARWWRDTGGVDDPRLVFWHSFEPGTATFGLDGVVNEIGRDLQQNFGIDFARMQPPERLDAVKRLLVQYRALLIWDNFESVREMPDPTGAALPLDEAASTELKAFLDWIRDHSTSTVLITSRAQEPWLGEVRRIGVGGLDRAESTRYAGHLLEPYPAARRNRERRSFGELLQWLDGHPLAMRLTLPRLDTTDPATLLADLRGTTPLSPVDAPAAGEPSGDRTTSLAASITYSYAHLADQTRRLLPAVSLFHGIANATTLAVFSDPAFVARVSGSSIGQAPGRFAGVSGDDWSAALADASRVGLLTDVGGGLYLIHPALPGYLAASWRAEDPGGYDQERQACEQALCSACAAFGYRLTEQIASENAALAYTMIGLERRTLGAMLGHALDHHAWDKAELIVRALDAYWDTRGLGAEAAAWADRILDATTGPGQVPIESARELWLYTTIAQATRQKNAGQPGQAAQTYSRALRYVQDQPATEWTRENIAVLCHQIGMTAQVRGRLDEADDWFRKSLAIERELGLRGGMALTYHHLSMTAEARGRLDEADDWCRNSLAISKELGHRPQMALSYHQLGSIAEARGRLDEADDWYQRAIQIREELGLRALLAVGYHQLGMTAQARGRLDSAEDWFRKSLAIQEALGNRSGLACTYHELGTIAQVRGRLDDAEDWYRKALSIDEEFGDHPGRALTYGQIGLLAEARQQPRQALDWTIRSVSLLREYGPAAIEQGLLLLLARLAGQLGMPALEEAWRLVTGQQAPQEVRDYIASQPDQPSAGEP